MHRCDDQFRDHATSGTAALCGEERSDLRSARGHEIPVSPRILRAGLRIVKTHHSIGPESGAGPSPTVERRRATRTNAGRANAVGHHNESATRRTELSRTAGERPPALAAGAGFLGGTHRNALASVGGRAPVGRGNDSRVDTRVRRRAVRGNFAGAAEGTADGQAAPGSCSIDGAVGSAIEAAVERAAAQAEVAEVPGRTLGIREAGPGVAVRGQADVCGIGRAARRLRAGSDEQQNARRDREGGARHDTLPERLVAHRNKGGVGSGSGLFIGVLPRCRHQ